MQIPATADPIYALQAKANELANYAAARELLAQAAVLSIRGAHVLMETPVSRDTTNAQGVCADCADKGTCMMRGVLTTQCANALLRTPDDP